jgi:D-aminopeptidase
MKIDAAIDQLARAYPGPGGACAVLQRGEVVEKHTWGFANAERRIPFTPRTLFRMCSITKQFTCATLLAEFPDPSVLDADVRHRLPALDQAAPTTLQLCHNQSGLRDYWAVAMLHGSPVEAPFGDGEARRVIGGTRTLQFIPGTRYSYANQNFRLISDILEDRTGRSFRELLRRSIFERVGMHDALLAADTRAMPDGTEGYEGTPQAGFRTARNHILWTGDAGLGASLEDMIAWERFIDTSRDSPDTPYRRLSAPVSFADGTPAAYGFGLSRQTEWDQSFTGHGGALRGWRSHRLYLPSERVSVIVMFNHLSDAHAAAMDLLAAALGVVRTPRPSFIEAPPWAGAYLEPETSLVARIDLANGQLRLRFGHSAERLDPGADGSAGNAGTRLEPCADGVWMERRVDHQRSLLRRCDAAARAGAAPQSAAAGRAGAAPAELVGRYRCNELDAVTTVIDAGGILYGAFSGFLGEGRMEMLEYVAPDVWLLPCPRALDHTPPGDWTLAFRRDSAGRVVGVTVGCWLARGLDYERIA